MGAGLEVFLLMLFRSQLRLAVSGLALLAMLAPSLPARAESLADAMVAAYQTNPTIRAERARQRGTDEQVPQALSGWRPTISTSASAESRNIDVSGPDTSTLEPANVSIRLSQPLFRGFKTVSQTAVAEANVRAGRAALDATQQQVLLQAAAVYMNVVRDRQVVELRQQDVRVLEEQLKAANARFNVGEITRTDVAQARASLSQSQSNLSAARSQLESSLASYEQIIGSKPGSLANPGVPKSMPKSLDEVIAAAEKANPSVLQAFYAEVSARNQIGVVRADLLPKANLTGDYATYNDYGNQESTTGTVKSLGGELSMPLYEGGEVYSGVRQAKQSASQRRIQVIEQQRDVRQAAIAAWADYQAARQTIVSAGEQVKASQLALEGVKQEALVGSRTTLDVLNAQQDVVNAELRLAQAQRDEIVGAYQVIAATGQLTPQGIGLGVPEYDPKVNYKNTKWKFIGTGVDTVE